METERIAMAVVAATIKCEDGDAGGQRVLVPARYAMAVMGCVAIAIIYGNQASVSFALIAMVNHTAIRPNDTSGVPKDSASACVYQEEDEVNVTTAPNMKDGPFAWDERVQGLILSAYSWGSMIAQIPAGRIAELFSAKWLLFGSIILDVVACMLSPFVAQLHYAFFMVLRVLQGVCGGVAFPSMHVMIAKWSPPAERNMFSSIIYAGSMLGIIISMGISGVLADRLGWAAVFYVQGPLPLIWCVVWWLLVEDSPDQQTRLITQREKDYIQRSLGKTKRGAWEKKLPAPWGQMFRSVPFWAILVSHFCSHFGWTIVLAELPSFMIRIMKFTPSQSAGLLVVFYTCMWIFSMITARSLKHLQSTGKITMSMSRKIAMLIANIIPICSFIGIGYVGCNRTLTVVIIIVAITSLGATFSGYVINHIDIAPNFAGSLVAVSSTFASLSGFIAPIIVAAMLQENHTMEVWRNVFFMAAGIYAVDILSYVIFSSTEVQPWNDMTKKDGELVERPCHTDEMTALRDDNNI